MPDQVSGILSPWLREKRIEAAYPFLKGKILDVGCGTGFLAKFITSENYLGVDIDEESLTIARRKNPSWRFQKEYPEGEAFDTILLLAVIEHVNDPVNFLRGLKTLLKTEGHIILTTPHPSMIVFHHLGSKINIFSKEAHDEHQDVFNFLKMKNLTSQAQLEIIYYRRFLFGANQLFVVRCN
jgi:2-polyprenyl-3-methyl-5-hydroxy-6-metoxy-1,4-benzoquinol methylase